MTALTVASCSVQNCSNGPPAFCETEMTKQVNIIDVMK